MNAFATAAAKTHNILTPQDRVDFATCTDAVDAESWAMLVVYDLSSRCRSFTPVVLANLVQLGREAGAIDAI
jgi:hypothetical protein